MALIDVNWKPSRTELRVFAVLQLVFFLIVAWVIQHRTGAAAFAAGVLAGSAAAALLGLVAPTWLRPFYVVWMAAVLPIGWVVSHLLLAALFYLVLTPIGLMMRLLGRDPLQRKFDPAAGTYWQPRRPPEDTRQYFRQF